MEKKVLLNSKIDKKKFKGKVNFVMYSNKNKNYYQNKIDNYKIALKGKVFDNIYLFDDNDLDRTYIEKTSPFIKMLKGGGYWLWKPYVVNKVLNEMNEGDYLFYMDAGCLLKKKIKSKITELLELFENDKNDSGIIGYQIEFEENEWTKKEIFDFFNLNKSSEIYNSEQVFCTFFVIKKNKKSVDVINKWLDIATNYTELFSDNIGREQDERFKECRHDQSIFSILLKLNKCIILNKNNYKINNSFFLRSHYNISLFSYNSKIKKFLFKIFNQNF